MLTSKHLNTRMDLECGAMKQLPSMSYTPMTTVKAESRKDSNLKNSSQTSCKRMVC